MSLRNKSKKDLKNKKTMFEVPYLLRLVPVVSSLTYFSETNNKTFSVVSTEIRGKVCI